MIRESKSAAAGARSGSRGTGGGAWENQNEKGEVYYTVTLAKTYEDKNGRLQYSHSFSGAEVLRVAELGREAFGVIRDVRRDMALDQQAERDTPPREDQPRRFQNRPSPSMAR